jgi:excisionase family DNA binding protein
MLLKADEAAKVLQVARSKVFAMCASGEIPCVRIGRSVRIPAVQLREWVERQISRQAAEAGEL